MRFSLLPAAVAIAGALLLVQAVAPVNEARVAKPAAGTALPLDCASAKTLPGLVECILRQMPKRLSHGFVVPSDAARADWRTVAERMLAGECGAITLPPTLSGAYLLRKLNDKAAGKTYCVLMEAGDANGDGIVDRGWGTLVVDARAARPLAIQVAHPLGDLGTAEQGVGVVQGVGAKALLMAGTHPDANPVPCDCQAGANESDVAHTTRNMFTPTTQALAADVVTIQFHGMASTSCVGTDVRLTHGRDVAPAAGSTLRVLRDRLAASHPGWSVTVPGDALACGLNGATNVQGRLLNGVAPEAACGTPATATTGRFIHVEQKPGHRSASDWIPAIAATWPAG